MSRQTPGHSQPYGAEPELHRFEAKQLFRKHDMDVPPTARIVGMDRLKAYLKDPENDNSWIKISRYRSTSRRSITRAGGSRPDAEAPRRRDRGKLSH
ncbi:MAG: hypothetical protein ABI895_08355 [Deltaproteobacteria bacterium]